MKTRVFVSYTSKDPLITDERLKQIESRIQPFAYVFIDRLHNKQGGQSRVEFELSQCDVLMHLVSPQYESKWVQQELDLAKKKGKPVFETTVDNFLDNGGDRLLFNNIIMNSSANKTIKFTLGEETRHVIETIDDEKIEESLFSDQYKKALSSLDNLLSINVPLISKNDDEAGPANNIISFIGDRGAGKTSCMMSITHLLKNGLNGEIKVAYPNVAYNKYYCMERIDPSFFDETHNVIELFLANLYKNFQDKINENRRKSSDVKDETQARKVFEVFAKAQKMMTEMTKPQRESMDVLDDLQNLSAGVQLGSLLKELVEAFFEYLNNKSGVLVLPIDDIDLNSRQAPEMLEQIRKYLIQPNIILLLSVKIDQLALTKRIHIQKEYEIIRYSEMLKGGTVLNDMVEAYLTKLLPHQQRVYLPEGTAYFYTPVQIIKKIDNKEYVEPFPSVRLMVTELIFRKTRYLFYNSPEKTSYIVPNNLRELRILTSLLCNMKDYWSKDDGNHSENNLYNKLLFRKYLYENWVTNNLDVRMQKIVSEILAVQDVAQINAKVLASLVSVFRKKLPTQVFTPKSRINVVDNEIAYIIDSSNTNYNIAVGDVLDIIDYLEESETEIMNIHFLFLLRSYYSMRLYQEYDAVSDNQRTPDKVMIQTRLSELNLTEYDKLVGGFYINTRISRLVPQGSHNFDYRSARQIDFVALQRLITQVLDEHGKNTNRLRLAEFFVLGISRRYDTKDENIHYKYRKSDAVFYAESLENISKNVFFDIGALMYNLTRMEACYKRIKQGDKLYDLAYRESNSLLSLFRSKSIEEKQGSEDHIFNEQNDLINWKSWCSFRNAEIIRAFKIHMATFKSPGGGLINIIAKSFKRMGEFSIPIYDKKEDGTLCQINFSYWKEIGSLLECEDIQDYFLSIFGVDSEDLPVPELIDVNVIVRGAHKDKNKKSTRLKRILSIYPTIGLWYDEVVNKVFDDYGDYMTRDEIINATKKLNDVLATFR